MSVVFQVGDRVRLVSQPTYVKTADPMPMLRPGHLLTAGTEGILISRRPGAAWSVRFAVGTFLLAEADLEKIA